MGGGGTQYRQEGEETGGITLRRKIEDETLFQRGTGKQKASQFRFKEVASA